MTNTISYESYKGDDKSGTVELPDYLDGALGKASEEFERLAGEQGTLFVVSVDIDGEIIELTTECDSLTWRGEGWYVMDGFDHDTGNRLYSSRGNLAYWFEDPEDYWYNVVTIKGSGYDLESSYEGDGLLPEDEGAEVVFVDQLPEEAAKLYEERRGE